MESNAATDNPPWEVVHYFNRKSCVARWIARREWFEADGKWVRMETLKNRNGRTIRFQSEEACLRAISMAVEAGHQVG